MSPLVLTMTLAVAGAVVVAVGLAWSRRPALGGVAEYLRDVDGAPGGVVDQYQRQLAEPFFVRVVRPFMGSMHDAVDRLTPRNYLQTTHRNLQLAGLTSTMRAQEFVVAQVIGTALLTLAALAYSLFGGPSARTALLVLILAPVVGLLLPPAWLARKVRERQDAIRRDLPDTLDLLAISVEAGMAFEGALAVVCSHFNSPLADEFARTLREMELGLPRKDAFTNLKHRTEVTELSNLVLALLQADGLGIPVGRVLKTQASEMRLRRRQWAREKAGKLPVKMLVPLVLFVFPAIMVVILGPAVPGIYQALR
jgi:tight adherence protein C